MKNPVPYLRKAFFDLLDGQVTYLSESIPVLSGEGNEVRFEIFIAETSITDRSDKHSFSGRGSQLIEVVERGTGKLVHKHVDAIGEQVMDLIQPAPRETGISTTEFQIIGLKKDSQNYLDERSGTGSYITRLLLRYSFYINQINLVQES